MSKDTPLGARITAEKRRNGNSLNDLTVLAAINDPYRLDTPANHRDAEWLVEQTQRLRVRTPNSSPGPALCARGRRRCRQT